jgi:adenosylcobinamide-phosphate synthase
MSLELQIVLALLLDAIVGDPPWLPHPVRLIGRLAAGIENPCRKAVRSEKSAGILAVLLILAATALGGWGAIRLAALIHPRAGELVSVLILYSCFAARDLISHSKRVHAALEQDDLDEARRRVGMIVGRDTAQLDRQGVVRACVESVAENTVDGITAPLFWAAVGGPVGVLLYKAVNTMDSIFGYKNERYLDFGWAPARLDDLVNWLPARITAVLMVAAARCSGLSALNAWRIFRRDRHNHASPNAGQSEAVMAGALGIRLGGPAVYFGKPVLKPVIGDDTMSPEPGHIDQANRLAVATTALMVLLVVSVLFLGGMLSNLL